MNDRVFAYFKIEPGSPQWLDWKWQYRNRITDAEGLSQIMSLDAGEAAGIEHSLTRYKMAITPYFASIMDPDDPSCPIRMQAVPSAEETNVRSYELEDPLNESRDSPVGNIIHRYPDRAVFLVSHRCAMYCRHCIRKSQMGDDGFKVGEAAKREAIDYIAGTPEIRDVLVSGGDPLMMDDDYIEDIIARIRDIPHVEVIRIGTRAPSALPMRITAPLLSMLRKYHPIWINTQFNHANELTPEALKACADIVDAGVPLGNQSVLLRNVNDDADTMKRLLLKLVKARVRPYYMYQCDLCEGAGHFRTRVETGLEIIKSLTGNISGYAIPEFVIDAPGGGGKIPLNPDYIVELDDEKIIMRNYLDKIYTYQQPY